MSTGYGDIAKADETTPAEPAARGDAGSALRSSLLYGTGALALTCGPLLIPGLGLQAALLWIVGGGTAVFAGLLLWAVVRGIREASGRNARRWRTR